MFHWLCIPAASNALLPPLSTQDLLPLAPEEEGGRLLLIVESLIEEDFVIV
jgi:hypothetical protein